jgi:hypothetical protein
MYPDKNIGIILHTNDYNYESFDKIITLFLKDKLRNKINIHVPFFALSARIELALFDDKINAMPNSLFSSIDVQCFCPNKFSSKYILI